MSTPRTADLLETLLAEFDARLALDASAFGLHVERGRLLELLGRKDEAVQAYVEVLRHAPNHADALDALGLLCLAAGNRSAARTLLSGAVLHGSGCAAAHAHLAYLNVLDERHDAARTLYEAALRLDPTLAIAHHGYAQLLNRTGDDAGAAHHRSLGLHYRPITIERCTGEGNPVRLLALEAEARGNIPTDEYFDKRIFEVAAVAVDHVDPDAALPPHDIVVNVIGEADLCADALARAAAIVARTNAPVVNDPAAVAATTRAANARRLGGLDGVVTARTVAVARGVLTGAGAADALAALEFTFPLLLRSPGHHTGDHFAKVDAPGDLAGAVAALPGSELLVIDYLELRDAHDCFRKYRVMMVDGRLYPLHLAISRAWKVHYFSADMAESAAHRAEEAAFLSDMQAVLGPRAGAALERIRDLLGLDYGGIDFTLDAAGNVVVFEANASMIVPLPEAGERWDHRRAPVAQIHAAVRAMLTNGPARYRTQQTPAPAAASAASFGERAPRAAGAPHS